MPEFGKILPFCQMKQPNDESIFQKDGCRNVPSTRSSAPYPTSCGKIFLTHKRPFPILPINKRKFLSILIHVDMAKENSLDDAREYIKALAPWIKDDQIEYDSDMNPVGVSGAHTPFPPFHWKCRTSSVMI